MFFLLLSILHKHKLQYYYTWQRNTDSKRKYIPCVKWLQVENLFSAKIFVHNFKIDLKFFFLRFASLLHSSVFFSLLLKRLL